ncbi:hypothetical protein [Pseudocnuella soli]|uniref:hypothetical protein n=1 Tax=Pseudocnuella soli TaxID=2502779 RepID=UPI0010432139|nr:hypothetical protein [Pseudocnuella soli]
MPSNWKGIIAAVFLTLNNQVLRCAQHDKQQYKPFPEQQNFKSKQLPGHSFSNQQIMSELAAVIETIEIKIFDLNHVRSK